MTQEAVANTRALCCALDKTRNVRHDELPVAMVDDAELWLGGGERVGADFRSDEHTSELQSLMRISYAVFCLKKKKKAYKQTSNAHKHNTNIYNKNEITT